jgi:hypothetical protein
LIARRLLADSAWRIRKSVKDMVCDFLDRLHSRYFSMWMSRQCAYQFGHTSRFMVAKQLAAARYHVLRRGYK